MAAPLTTIRCKAKLLRPARPKGASWTFLVLPAAASAKLPTRGMTTVEGTLNGAAFRATLSPDGNRSHWLEVSRELREAAEAEVGQLVELRFAPSATQLEPKVPTDLRRALAAAPAARSRWSQLTTIARRDWVQWITTAKKAETRSRRIAAACDMLASGKRNVCCFDRSGIYGKNLSAPEAADG